MCCLGYSAFINLRYCISVSDLGFVFYNRIELDNFKSIFPYVIEAMKYYDKEYQRDLEAYHKKNKELMAERDAQAKRAMEAQLAGDKAQKAVAELKQKQAEEELKSLQRPMHESERKKRVEANA